MTVVETIRIKTQALPPEQQKEVLEFVESIELRQVPGLGNASLDALKKALADARGIWKDRSDMPENSADAAQWLRDRASQRGGQ